jgi:hypothetical protein
MGIGAGQKILGVDISFDFVRTDESIQFPAMQIYIKDSAPIGECGKRVGIRHMWNVHSPPNDGDIQHWLPFWRLLGLRLLSSPMKARAASPSNLDGNLSHPASRIQFVSQKAIHPEHPLGVRLAIFTQPLVSEP